MININTSRIDKVVEKQIALAAKVEAFRKERVETLTNASCLLEEFLKQVGCKDLEIGNMYSTGLHDFQHEDECRLLCHATMVYDKKAPKNKNLYIKKLQEAFNSIIKANEERIYFDFQLWNITDNGVKFEIYIKK